MWPDVFSGNKTEDQSGYSDPTLSWKQLPSSQGIQKKSWFFPKSLCKMMVCYLSICHNTLLSPLRVLPLVQLSPNNSLSSLNVFVLFFRNLRSVAQPTTVVNTNAPMACAPVIRDTTLSIIRRVLQRIVVHSDSPIVLLVCIFRSALNLLIVYK